MLGPLGTVCVTKNPLSELLAAKALGVGEICGEEGGPLGCRDGELLPLPPSGQCQGSTQINRAPVPLSAPFPSSLPLYKFSNRGGN